MNDFIVQSDKQQLPISYLKKSSSFSPGLF